MARIVQTIPIRISNNLEPELEIHQYPLLSRQLQVPPSARDSGKRIRARTKPQSGLYEVHIPADTRSEVWNSEKAKDLGAARTEEDAEEKHATAATKGKLEEPTVRRLADIRMRSEQMPDRAVYMLATVRDGEIHLHPVSRTLQFRPTMTYLDVLARKQRPRRTGADSDSDDGPPPDPDEPQVPSVPKAKKKVTIDAREVQLSAKKAQDDKLQVGFNNLSQVRQEMLAQLRIETTESWQDWEYCDVDVSGGFSDCTAPILISCKV
jgi:DNA-directed RNA polymerase-3 subunit RPC5